VSVAFHALQNPFAPDVVAPGSRHPEIGEVPRVLPPPPNVGNVSPIHAAGDVMVFQLVDLQPGGELVKSDGPDGKAAVTGNDLMEPAAAPGEQLAQAATDDSAFVDAGPESNPDDAARISGGGPFMPLDPPSDAKNAPRDANYAMVPPAPADLPDGVLSLGQSVRLAAEIPPEPREPDGSRRCLRKQRGTVQFCIEPVDWPPGLESRMRISSVMYQGARAIVRYDEGRASRVHSLFPANAFGEIVAYYRARFGTPDEAGEHQITPFAQPRRGNMTVVWRRLDPATERHTTLEIRNFDDARGGFPDLRHGAILLYDEASPPIFPVLSTLDLMPTRRR
jgi:hypothetical protein